MLAFGKVLAFLLAFTALLRISEVAGLRVCDVVFPEGPRFWGVAYVVLALAHTKTGDDLSAEVRANWLWPMLRAWVRTKAPGGATSRLLSSLRAVDSPLDARLDALSVLTRHAQSLRENAGSDPEAARPLSGAPPRGPSTAWVLAVGRPFAAAPRPSLGDWERPESAPLSAFARHQCLPVFRSFSCLGG